MKTKFQTVEDERRLFIKVLDENDCPIGTIEREERPVVKQLYKFEGAFPAYYLSTIEQLEIENKVRALNKDRYDRLLTHPRIRIQYVDDRGETHWITRKKLEELLNEEG